MINIEYGFTVSRELIQPFVRTAFLRLVLYYMLLAMAHEKLLCKLTQNSFFIDQGHTVCPCFLGKAGMDHKTKFTVLQLSVKHITCCGSGSDPVKFVEKFVFKQFS
jgi:hypothetical protein